MPVSEAEAALQMGLADLQWSGVGVLDGLAGADDAVAACMHLLKWCAALINRDYVALNCVLDGHGCRVSW